MERTFWQKAKSVACDAMFVIGFGVTAFALIFAVVTLAKGLAEERGKAIERIAIRVVDERLAERGIE